MTQVPEVGLHQPPKPLAPALHNDIAYQWELLSNIAGEMWPLIVEKSAETFPDHATRPPDPDWKRYAHLQAAGVLQILTARAAGKLVGYVVWMVDSNLHRRTEGMAICDTYFVTKEWRKKHRIGRTLFEESNSRLHQLGCCDILAHSNEQFSSAHDGLMHRFFTSLGYKPHAIVYRR